MPAYPTARLAVAAFMRRTPASRCDARTCRAPLAARHSGAHSPAAAGADRHRGRASEPGVRPATANRSAPAAGLPRSRLPASPLRTCSLPAMVHLVPLRWPQPGRARRRSHCRAPRLRPTGRCRSDPVTATEQAAGPGGQCRTAPAGCHEAVAADPGPPGREPSALRRLPPAGRLTAVSGRFRRTRRAARASALS